MGDLRAFTVSVLLTLILVSSSASTPAPLWATGAEEGGSIHRVDLETFETVETFDGDEASEEFGTQVGYGGSAPGAEGGGRIYLFWRDGAPLDSATALDLSLDDVSRLGEDMADLGHPPGTSNALAVGAPGDPTAGRNGSTPAVVVVSWVDLLSVRFDRVVRRVTGPPGSLFGWRVKQTDPILERSFSGAFLVGAPLEGNGRRRHSGAVYKFETETGNQLWRFRGERADELAGYDLLDIADRNDDGVPEVLVGAPGSRDGAIPGRVYILSGATGDVLARIDAPDEALLFGYALDIGFPDWELSGFLIGAPGTAKGKKSMAGAVYHYPDVDAVPTVFRGRRRDQWFGISVHVTPNDLFVGSFEGHRKPTKDRRGSVTILTHAGKTRKTLRGARGGDYFGRALTGGESVLTVGAPGAPPLYVPE